MHATMNYLDRQQALQRKMDWSSAPALLVTDVLSVHYLTGFPGHEFGDGWVLVTPQRAILFSDDRYSGTLRGLDSESVIWPATARYEKLREFLPAAPGPLAFQKSLSYGALERLRLSLPGYEFVPAENHIEALRLLKSPEELAFIREAASFTDRVFQEALGYLKVGMTERQLRTWLNSRLREVSGTDEIAFGTIVASGTNGDTPHAEVSDRVIRAGEFVTIDMGARNGHYHSDMTRTVLMGGADPHPELLRAWLAVLDSQILGVQAVQPGVSTRDVDAACRESLKAAGLDQYFTHSTGHGVGLEIHEEPRLSPKADSAVPLEPGMVVTIEPGVYIPHLGGIRIEDLVVVTPTGHEVYSHSPKDLAGNTIPG